MPVYCLSKKKMQIKVKEIHFFVHFSLTLFFFFPFSSSDWFCSIVIQHNAERLLKLIEEIYRWLPLGTIVNNRVFVVHGGISDTTDLDLLKSLDRGKVSLCGWSIQPQHKNTISFSPYALLVRKILFLL